MNTLTNQELINKIKMFCKERDWDQYHNPKDLAIGVSTEANELLDIFRFKTEKQSWELFNTPLIKEHIEEEVADVMFFLLRFVQMNNLDLDIILDDKIKKNAVKYPVDSTKGKIGKHNL